MKSPDQLIALHLKMRKLAYERVGDLLAKTVKEKLGSNPAQEAHHATRSDQPR